MTKRFIALALLVAACARDASSRGDVVPANALATIDTATLMQHIRVLSNDSLLGRAPGTVGEDKTVAYIEGQFKTAGLKPDNTDGTYIQKVPLVGITVKGAPALTFTK